MFSSDGCEEYNLWLCLQVRVDDLLSGQLWFREREREREERETRERERERERERDLTIKFFEKFVNIEIV